MSNGPKYSSREAAILSRTALHVRNQLFALFAALGYVTARWRGCDLSWNRAS